MGWSKQQKQRLVTHTQATQTRAGTLIWLKAPRIQKTSEAFIFKNRKKDGLRIRQ